MTATTRRVGRPRNPVVDERLYAAATNHITTHGLHTLNVKALIRDVHTGKGSFYRRWPDVEHFLADLVRHLQADPTTAPRANTVLFSAGKRVRELVGAGP